MSRSALVKKRAYSRCRIAWVTPPTYWSIGAHFFASSRSKGPSDLPGLRKRRKYQDESTNVSIVSVSRRAAPPHFGQVVLTHSVAAASGD